MWDFEFTEISFLTVEETVTPFVFRNIVFFFFLVLKTGFLDFNQCTSLYLKTNSQIYENNRYIQ